MAADTASVGPNEVPCPDPSVHEHHNKLSEQASTAALYVTHQGRQTETHGASAQVNPLGPDGKLSSKSAATSLKYAKAQDLPSFPSRGYVADSAGKAAMLAKDYKMKELWQPEQSSAGSRAATLANAKGGKLDLWQASATADGHSAATLAMRNKSLSPNVDYGVTTENKSKALQAATMSHNKGRQRAGSTPQPRLPQYPDSHNSTANALNAATASHRASTMKMAPDGWDSEANQAARFKNIGSRMEPEMFGEHPPVETDGGEAKHQAALRASAISMAKQIYETQNRTALTSDPAEITGAQVAASRNSASAQPDIKQEAMRYISLQETAHKLAAERLAKVDKNMEASRYREYYGYEDKPKRLSSRMSLRSVGGRGRNRASSEGTRGSYDSDDEEQARRIRTQMSQLSSGLGQVDQKKQQDDRAKLLAAAEKKVQQRMHNMDEKVFADTGKVSPALMEEWEAKARERAQKEREQQAEHPGKTHIGGGKFMEQSEIEAIAAARLKPTLDEINDTAEKRRARDAELQQEKEEEERNKRFEKAQQKDEKAEQKRLKDEEKAAAKQQKDEEKARKEEEKRLAKEEKRKSREAKREDTTAIAGGATSGEVAGTERGEDEPANEDADEAVKKHQSALSRLKNKFRKSNPTGEEAAVDDEGRPSTSKSTSSKKEAATGVVAGAATSATMAETPQHKQAEPGPLDYQQAQHAVEQDEVSPSSPAAHATETKDFTPTYPIEATPADDDDKWKPIVANSAPVAAGATAVPTIVADDDDSDDERSDAEQTTSNHLKRPSFEQQPSFTLQGDDVAEPSAQRMPNLERHISQIPESDDDDSDDEDWNDDRSERRAGGPVAASAVAPGFIGNQAAETHAPAESLNATADRVEQAPKRLDDQRAEPPQDVSITSEPPKTTAAAATAAAGGTISGEAANAAVPDADIQLKTDEGKKDHSILRQIVNPHGKKHDEQAYGTTAHAATVEPESRASASEEQYKTSVDDDGRNKLHKKSAPAESRQANDEEKQKSQKGVRGFFSKLRHRGDSKSDNKTSEAKSASEPSKGTPYESHKAGEEPVTTGTVSKSASSPTAATDPPTPLPAVDTTPAFGEEHRGTDGQIGDSTKISGIGGKPEPDSPSSFRRGETALKDPDEVSSSGAEEDDIQRGRGGRGARKLGFGNSRTQNETAVATSGNEGSGEDEQFEEARDHFDESLAPPPAFGGQAKSESPVRGTKFQEEL